jgi:hypothetical protein
MDIRTPDLRSGYGMETDQMVHTTENICPILVNRRRTPCIRIGFDPAPAIGLPPENIAGMVAAGQVLQGIRKNAISVIGSVFSI